MNSKPPTPVELEELEPVTEFIRMLISEWEKADGLLKDLAAQAGLAKSMPSQIKARTSKASFYSASKLARPLGFKDLPDLVHAAYAWWHSNDRTVLPESAPDAPRAEAMRLVQAYGVTQEQIDAVCHRWPLEDYEDKDALWWLARFHEQRTIDAERAGQRRAERSAEASKGRVRKKKQEQLRELKDRAPPSVKAHPKRHAS